MNSSLIAREPDTPRRGQPRRALTDTQLRLLIVEATRVLNGDVRECRIERSGGGIKVIPLSRVR